MTNKKGISDVVITLIIIGIALIVVGIVWYVIQNVLNQGESKIYQGMDDLFGDCTSTDIGGLVMINITHIEIDTFCDTDLNQVKAINGKYCCIPIV